MGIMFGGSPVQTPSIDAVLAGMGLGQTTPAGSPDPASVLAGLGIQPPTASLNAAPSVQGDPAQPGFDLSSLLSQPSATTQQAAPPAQANAPSDSSIPAIPDLPKASIWDKILYGVDADTHAYQRFGQRLGVIQQTIAAKRAQDQFAALSSDINNLPDGPEKQAALADPMGWLKIQQARMSPFDTKAGETHGFGNNTFYTAPVTGIANGRGYSVDGSGVASTGGAVIPGKQIVDPGSGAVVDENTGPTGTFLPQFHSAPVADNAGYTAPNGANLAPGLGGGAAPTGGTQGAAPNAASPDAYSAAVVKLESGGNPNARNGSSIGILQFHPSTFKQFNPTGDINNPADQQVALQNETAHNTQVLQGVGLQATPQNLYLLHQQGTSGGLALLQNPDKNAVQTLVDGGFYPNPRIARRAITRNYGTADMTGGQFAGLWGGKLSRALRQTGGAAAVTAGPAQSVSQGGSQFPSGWQGKGYSYDPKTGVVTSPQGQPSAGPGFYGPEQVQAARKGYYDSNEHGEAVQATAALNSLNDAIKKFSGNNGVIDVAAVANLARAETGLSARQGTMDTLMDHLGGLPQAVQGQAHKLFGNGPITVENLRQLHGMLASYATSKRAIAQERIGNEEANAGRFGQKLGLSLPALDATPNVKWFNGGAASGPGAPTAGGGAGNAQATLAEAKSAIQRGAPRAAVIARLQQMGINPAGL